MQGNVRLLAMACITLFAVVPLAACDQKPPATASLTHTYTLVDEHGTTAGTVTLQAVGGGELFDVSGKEIGRIVPP